MEKNNSISMKLHAIGAQGDARRLREKDQSSALCLPNRLYIKLISTQSGHIQPTT